MAVKVTHRGKTIAHAKNAISFLKLCGPVKASHAMAEQEVMRRIGLYLAWRKIVAKKPARARK